MTPPSQLTDAAAALQSALAVVGQGLDGVVAVDLADLHVDDLAQACLLLLQKYLRAESLRFLTVFSSVAGRYGNSGQSDYATANELMNRLCCQLYRRWGGQVNVNALCWGPWGPTMFGAGMVTAETEAKFAEKGVYLVTAADGRQLLKDELLRTDDTYVEIICGAGPWEQREADLGRVQLQAPSAPGKVLGALLGAAEMMTLPMGGQVVSFAIDANHAYLQEHRIDATPVLPAAVALELLSQAGHALWPGWRVVEVKDFRLMKGVELKEAVRRFDIVINPPPYGSAEGFEVVATLQAVSVPVGRIYTVQDIAEDPHYRARGMIERIVTATGQVLEVPGIVPKLSATPGAIRTLAPGLGETDPPVARRAEQGYSA